MADKNEDKKEDVEKTKVTKNKPNTSGKAEEGSTVKVHYKGTLDSGDVFDSSEGKDPIEFKVGQHMVIKGFEDAIVGMKPGDKKQIELKPDQAYGEPQDELKQKLPKEAFGDIDLEEGMQLALNHPQSPGPIPVTVLKIEDDGVTIDMNHPLAGKKLKFDLELVSVE